MASSASTAAPVEPGPDRRQWWRRALAGPRALQWLGAGLLALWLGWFVMCLAQDPLPRALPRQGNYLEHRFTYILEGPFMGVDFQHNYSAARQWTSGDDPYAALQGDPFNPRYTYPPLTLAAFSWARAFRPGPEMTVTFGGSQALFRPSRSAIVLWLCTAAGLVAIAAGKSWEARARLGLSSLPLPFVLGATLLSYPVLFELERGNCNTLPLIAMVVLVGALGWPHRLWGDAVMGLCVAGATGIKPFGIVLLLGLVALRRNRAALFAVAWLLLEGVFFRDDLRRWLAVANLQNQSQATVYLDFSHSPISHWQFIARDVGWTGLARLPAEIVVAALLLAPALAVSWRVFRRRSSAIAWPFVLWLAALATFVSPVAQDYNLLFVPLAILAAWNARDAWWVQLCVAFVLPWWQPFFTGLANLPWLLLKLVSVILVGGLLLRRLQQEDSAGTARSGAS